MIFALDMNEFFPQSKIRELLSHFQMLLRLLMVYLNDNSKNKLANNRFEEICITFAFIFFV